jgi:ABC-2 type transport system ATP-binding protein
LKVIIQAKKLAKYYGKGGEIKAVDELDLEVFEGETFGLLGPNGAGKTTTTTDAPRLATTTTAPR